MTDSTSPSYPNIAQSFAICGIVILGFILSSPVNFLMDEIIGKEGAGLLYYLAAMGVSFYAMSSIGDNSISDFGYNRLVIWNNYSGWIGYTYAR